MPYRVVRTFEPGKVLSFKKALRVTSRAMKPTLVMGTRMRSRQ